MPKLQLAGASVVLTRPAASAAALRRRVRALGAVAVALPGFSLRPTGDPAAVRAALRESQRADVVVFSSPAAVRFAWRLLPTLRFGRAVLLCGPGAGTAAALRRHGVRAVVQPHVRQDSEGLLELPELARVRRRRIVLVGAPAGRGLLEHGLRARGASVRSVFVYRRAPPRLDRRHFAALDAAPSPLISLFSSADALRNLRAALPPRSFARLAAGDCVVSSLRLAAVAQVLGCARVHVAASAQPAALLAAACGALAHHRL